MRTDNEDSSFKEPLIPFLKWPGGKRWFVQRHADFLPRDFRVYIEPFLGGGSVFFHLRPKSAVLGDLNEDLIATYQGIKTDWRQLEGLLATHQNNHSDAYYYQVRKANPSDPVERAARLIYLNRTCFNGIYRVNLDGDFNVPRGSKNTVVLDTDNFEALSEALKGAHLCAGYFEHLVDTAGKNDLVFADPPYTVRHNVNGFIKYNEKLFSWGDQETLAYSLDRAKKRGAMIVATNANHESVRSLYSRLGFKLTQLSRYSAISANAAGRTQYEELIITANI